MANASALQLRNPERMYPWEAFVHIQQFLGTADAFEGAED